MNHWIMQHLTLINLPIHVKVKNGSISRQLYKTMPKNEREPPFDKVEHPLLCVVEIP